MLHFESVPTLAFILAAACSNAALWLTIGWLRPGSGLRRSLSGSAAGLLILVLAGVARGNGVRHLAALVVVAGLSATMGIVLFRKQYQTLPSRPTAPEDIKAAGLIAYTIAFFLAVGIVYLAVGTTGA